MFDSFLKNFRNIYIKPTTSNGQNEDPSATIEFLMPIQEEIKEAPAQKKESTKEPATVTLSVEEALEMLNEKFSTVKNGKGVAYTIALHSLIGVSTYQLLSNDRTVKEGGKK